MRIDIYNIDQYVIDFQNLINKGLPKDELYSFETAKDLYATTFGYQSFSDFDLFIFKETLSNGKLKDVDEIKEINKNHERSLFAIETQYSSLEDIEEPSFEIFKAAVLNDPSEIFDMKGLSEEHFEYVSNRGFLLGHFPPCKNRDCKDFLEIEVFHEFIKPLLDFINEHNYNINENTIKSFLSYFKERVYPLIRKEFHSKAICDYMFELDPYLVYKKPEYTIKSIEKKPDIIGLVEQTEELVNIAFNASKKSILHFESKFQTFDRIKMLLDEGEFRFLSKVKQNEEIIEYALKCNVNAAAFVTPHFIKKMKLKNKYKISPYRYAIKFGD